MFFSVRNGLKQKLKICLMAEMSEMLTEEACIITDFPGVQAHDKSHDSDSVNDKCISGFLKRTLSNEHTLKSNRPEFDLVNSVFFSFQMFHT